MTDTDSSNPYDASFQLRERHPDFQRYLDQNDTLSAALRSEYELVPDVPYGDHPLQTIDWFPAAQPRSPVFVFIHGGYWKSLDKRSYHFTARPFLENGYAAAHINYRLAPEVTMADIVADVTTALEAIHEQSAQHNGDPAAFSVSGHSAGGHLVLMGLLQLISAKSPVADSIQKALSISGLFDLEPIRLSYLSADLRFDEATARQFSPINIQSINTQAKIVFAVGTGETDQFIKQSRDMADRLNALGHPSQYLTLNGMNHYEIVHELARKDSVLTQTILDPSIFD